MEVVESVADFSDLLSPFPLTPPLSRSLSLSIRPSFLLTPSIPSFLLLVFCSRFFRFFFHQSAAPPPPPFLVSLVPSLSSSTSPILLLLLLDPRVTLRNQSSFSLLRKFHVADRFNARFHGRDIGRRILPLFRPMRRRDERCRGVERRHNTRHVESSRAFLRSIARFCTSTDFSSNENRTEPKFERPLSNFSVYLPLRRRGEGRGRFDFSGSE